MKKIYASRGNVYFVGNPPPRDEATTAILARNPHGNTPRALICYRAFSLKHNEEKINEYA